MKGRILVFGSIIAVVLLVLVSSTSVVSSNLLKTENKTSSLDKFNIILETPLDRILQALFAFILGFFYWWSITHPPS